MALRLVVFMLSLAVVLLLMKQAESLQSIPASAIIATPPLTTSKSSLSTTTTTPTSSSKEDGSSATVHIHSNSNINSNSNALAYTAHWEKLLVAEYRETAANLRARRSKWSRQRLEESGMCLLDVTAEPESDLFGEKIVRVSQRNDEAATVSSKIVRSLNDRFSRGDVLVLTPTGRPPPTLLSSGGGGGGTSSRRRKRSSRKHPHHSSSFQKNGIPAAAGGGSSVLVPRQCCVVDVGTDWITVGVGSSWPEGLWEARRLPGSFKVRLDRTAPQAPLLAQQTSLHLTRNGKAGAAVALLVDIFCNTNTPTNNHNNNNNNNNAVNGTASKSSTTLSIGNAPSPLYTTKEIATALQEAKRGTAFVPNQSQEEAIAWALSRRISLIRGPPGTGKTRAAALLISTAWHIMSRSSTGGTKEKNREAGENDASLPPPRILAVAHSNGAADVLLEALLQMKVPAIRAGRPVSISPSVQHRTIVAMADKHPEVVALRRQARDMSLDARVRGQAAADARQYVVDIRQTILETAPVVVASCIGAHQLLEIDQDRLFPSAISASDRGRHVRFPLVVLDEAAQTTEPALLCALTAANAEQVVLVGDTKQLPPTVVSETPELRAGLGISPMARLEKQGVDQKTLRVQYRMPPSLLEHPSHYFYNGLVTCSDSLLSSEPSSPPEGFPWPNGLPLAFVHVGGGGDELEVAHHSGGRSNPSEADLVARIVSNLLDAGNVTAENIAVISPYSKQCQRIRSELAATRKSRKVRVGTVDSFQGQETDVVVFSCVRSNSFGEMGFLRDPRRLCVAITRARRGLILVGDKRVLLTSRPWAALLASCQERGCFLDVAEIKVRGTTKHDEAEPGKENYNTDVLSTRLEEGGPTRSSSVVVEEEFGSLLDEDDEMYGLF